MAVVEWDEKVEAFAPDGSDQSFAIRVCFGRARRRFQDPDAETFSSESQAVKIVSRSWMMNRYE